MPEFISKISLFYGLRPGQERFLKMHPNNPSHRKGELSVLSVTSFPWTLLWEEEVRFYLYTPPQKKKKNTFFFPPFWTNRFCHSPLLLLLHRHDMPQCGQTSRAVHKPWHSHMDTSACCSLSLPALKASHHVTWLKYYAHAHSFFKHWTQSVYSVFVILLCDAK